MSYLEINRSWTIGCAFAGQRLTRVLAAAAVALMAHGCGGSGGSDPPVVISPPEITGQPVSQTVDDGQSATFAVAASGQSLSYQWQRDGVDILGATTAATTISPASLADTGARLRVVVSNSAGQAISEEASLSVTAVPPAIVGPPASTIVSEGQTATFSVVARGSVPMSYQWLRAGVEISGATQSTYSLTSASASDSGALFTVRVSNPGGAVVSPAAALTVSSLGSAPKITAQPDSLTVFVGELASFSVTANGAAPLTYQWRRGNDNIAGANSSIYSTTAAVVDDGSSISVVVTDANGNATTSMPAVLTVQHPLPSGEPRLALGRGHAVAIRADGTVITWGLNNVGQLGGGSTIAGSFARSVNVSAQAVVGGQFESLALGSDGVVRGWGRKFASTSIIGGDAASAGTDVPSPEVSAFPNGMTHLTTGTLNGFAVALRHDGTVWHVPGEATLIAGGLHQAARQVPDLNGVVALGSGSGDGGAIAAIRSDGSVAIIRFSGVLPAGSWQASIREVAGLSGIVATSCAASFEVCLGLAQDGRVWRFSGDGVSSPTTPELVPGLTKVIRIGATPDSFHAVTADGRLWSWGATVRSGIGGFASNSIAVPTVVPGLSDVVEIAPGLQSVLVRLANGTVWGFGANTFGELGTGNVNAAQTPVQATGVNLN